VTGSRFTLRRTIVSAAVRIGSSASIVSAGDVISVAASQLLVEEAQPRSLALRLFELEGTDTLPPVGDSVRTLAPPAEDLAIDLGDVPTIEGFEPPRAAPPARSHWNYAAWVMAALLALVLGIVPTPIIDLARTASSSLF